MIRGHYLQTPKGHQCQ